LRCTLEPAAIVDSNRHISEAADAAIADFFLEASAPIACVFVAVFV
jgi:hypothetical protein